MKTNRQNKNVHYLRTFHFFFNLTKLLLIPVMCCFFFISCAALQEAQEIRRKRMEEKREKFPTLPASKSDTEIDTEGEKAESDNYTFTLAADMKTHEDFVEPEKRKLFLRSSLPYMESLYQELHERFGFEPEYKIHVTIHKNYMQNMRADTQKEYTISNEGKSLKSIKMNFPLSMYEDPGTRAHELTHAFTSAYFLPVWFDEGIAVMIQTEFARRGTHPKFDTLHKDIKRNLDGINSLEDWETAGTPELTHWRYSYAYTIIAELQKLYGEEFYIKAFQLMDADQLYNKLPSRMSTSFLVYYLSEAAGADLVPFFKRIHFNVRKLTKEYILQSLGRTNN